MPVEVSAPQRADMPFGICLRWPRSDAQMDLVASTGASIARVGCNWWHVERVQGTYDWADTDAQMQACESRGLRPFILLMGCPTWAHGTSYTGDIYGINTDAQRQGFAAFAAAAATRYSGRVVLWEVWNEANGGFWYPAPNATDYAALLKATVPAIRAHDNAPVASTGLAGNANLGDNEPLPWIDKMHAADAIGVADGFGFHPYSNGTGKVDGLLAQTRDVRVKLDRLGYSWLPMTATEVGLTTADNTEQRQADTFDLTVTYLRQIGLEWFCWYQDFDQTDNTGIPVTEQHFGVFQLDGTPKQVVQRMKAHAGAQRNAGTVRATQYLWDGTRLLSTTNGGVN